MKLLYAEDERTMSEAVADILKYHGFTVDQVYNGQSALEYLKKNQYDGIILDIMMPKVDGLTVLKQLREDGIKTPVLLLSAKTEVEDRIIGLDAGADDYLPKPFVMGELMARVRAMLRRKENYTPDMITVGNMQLDRRSFTLIVGERRMILPKQEYRVMEQLMLNTGTLMSTEDILVKAWGYDTDVEMGAVWVYISYLRRRLNYLGANVRLRAKRGVGYRLEVLE